MQWRNGALATEGKEYLGESWFFMKIYAENVCNLDFCPKEAIPPGLKP
jgi:hypothetical protein